MHIGLTTSLSSYPVNYLNEFFVAYGPSLETNFWLSLLDEKKKKKVKPFIEQF